MLIKFILTVLYAPDLGPTGLDVEKLVTRYDVYFEEVGQGSCDVSQDVLRQEMDEVIPFHPETVFYAVFSITVGK